MNLLTNYPDSLIIATAELLSKSPVGRNYPYCFDIRCSSCGCFNTNENKISDCLIETWCRENNTYLYLTYKVNWESFANAFLNTFTLQKYPHLYV